jgi:hypothetical protein
MCAVVPHDAPEARIAVEQDSLVAAVELSTASDIQERTACTTKQKQKCP